MSRHRSGSPTTSAATTTAAPGREADPTYAPGPLPTFVIIGAMKAGTTSLHHYLAQHPEIGMSSAKEPNFFCEPGTRDRGVGWYTSLFPADRPVRGEASVSYTKHPRFSEAPERMHALVPDARLVYVVRDPVARVVSHYLEEYSTGREQRALEDALAGDLGESHYVNTSRYAMQLERFDPYYPADRVLVVASEDLRANRLETIRRIVAFVGADPSFTSPEWDRLFYTAGEKTRKTSRGYALRRLSDRVADSPLRPLIPRALGRAAGQAARSLGARGARPIPRQQLSPELRARLVDALRDDVALLRARTGEAFPTWLA